MVIEQKMSVHAFFEDPVTIVLMIGTVCIVLLGFSIRLAMWGHGSLLSFLADWKHETFRDGWSVVCKTLIFDLLLFRRIWKRSRKRWLIHFILFWGFLFFAGFLILSLLVSLLVFAYPNGYGVIIANYLKDLHMPYDLLGYLLLAGTLTALGRRLLIRSVRKRSTIEDYILIAIVLIILLSGMVAEWFSGYATVVGKTFQNWDLALAWMDIHIYVALVFFIMILPWSKFKHIITVPLTLLARRGGE